MAPSSLVLVGGRQLPKRGAHFVSRLEHKLEQAGAWRLEVISGAMGAALEHGRPGSNRGGHAGSRRSCSGPGGHEDRDAAGVRLMA